MATLASPGGAAQGGGAGGPGGPGGDASPPRLARALAIGSGKGGVGKSTLALGIAWAAAERGVRTALVDADLGLANLDILCGLQPVRTAADWLAGRAPLAECFARVAPRLWLLPGASGVARMADLAPPQRVRLHGGLARVAAHVDLMVLDLGAGLGAGTLDLAVAADRLLVVCTPEPTSLADAYGFVKACARRGRTDRVELAVNMAHSVEAARVAAARVERTCARFLGVACPCAGVVPADAAVRASVEARRPLLSHAPRSEAARSVRRLEGALLGGGDAAASEVGARLAEGFLARMARALGLASRGSSEAPTTYSEGAPRGGHHPQGVSQPMPAMAR
jgi:flagellar biosynthesis protein FlhG